MQQFYIKLWRGLGGLLKAGMLLPTKDLTLFNPYLMFPVTSQDCVQVFQKHSRSCEDWVLVVIYL